MKGMLFLTAAAMLFAGCSSSEVRAPVRTAASEGPRYATPEEVQKLREEARENFARLQEAHGNPSRPRPVVARNEPRYERLPRIEEAPDTTTIYAAPEGSDSDYERSIARENAAERARELEERRWQVQQRANYYRVFEAGYARQLGKKPSQLTAEEKRWVRENFE